MESGTLLEKGAGHCWIWNAVKGREDDLLCVAPLVPDAVMVKTVMYHLRSGGKRMHATYWKDDDILEVRCSDKPIARETSENWHVHKSYAADDELVAVVFLDAVKEGYFAPKANGRKEA